MASRTPVVLEQLGTRGRFCLTDVCRTATVRRIYAGLSRGARMVIGRLGEQHLPGLFAEVRLARVALQRARCLGTSSTCRAGEERLVHALTAYIDELSYLQLPVPYALRDELRIHERVVFPARRLSGTRWTS